MSRFEVRLNELKELIFRSPEDAELYLELGHIYSHMKAATGADLVHEQFGFLSEKMAISANLERLLRRLNSQITTSIVIRDDAGKPILDEDGNPEMKDFDPKGNPMVEQSFNIFVLFMISRGFEVEIKTPDQIAKSG